MNEQRAHCSLYKDHCYLIRGTVAGRSGSMSEGYWAGQLDLPRSMELVLVAKC